VHERFSLEGIVSLKKEHPQAQVLAHPECKRPILMVADKVGSTAALLKWAVESEATEFIVATEPGILYEMQRQCPDKIFIPAPPEVSEGAVGCSCNDCSYMKLNTLERLRDCLVNGAPEVVVDASIAEAARRPIERMLELSR
jgi:quinolinate synthase